MAKDPCDICGSVKYQCEYRTYHLFDKKLRETCAEQIRKAEVL